MHSIGDRLEAELNVIMGKDKEYGGLEEQSSFIKPQEVEINDNFGQSNN